MNRAVDPDQMNPPCAIDYEMIFQHAPVGMCVSMNRVIQSCNHALATMFRYDGGKLHGQSFSVLYPTMDEFLRTGDRIVPIMNAKGRYSDERIMRRADGDRLAVLDDTGQRRCRIRIHFVHTRPFNGLAEELYVLQSREGQHRIRPAKVQYRRNTGNSPPQRNPQRPDESIIRH